MLGALGLHSKHHEAGRQSKRQAFAERYFCRCFGDGDLQRGGPPLAEPPADGAGGHAAESRHLWIRARSGDFMRICVCYY